MAAARGKGKVQRVSGCGLEEGAAGGDAAWCVEEAVLVPIEEWRRLQRERRPNIKEWLLGDGPRFEDIVPKRGGWRSRPATDFSGPEFE
jgi:hypothetical protein